MCILYRYAAQYIIKSMYSVTSYRLKSDDHISPSFLATSGVKQGCPMSPLLSNIYQSDLHEIFNGDFDPVKMGSAHINSISWAYDLMLLSTSKSGLQRCLENLKTHCQKCGLVVNTENTKTMVLSKKKYIPEILHLWIYRYKHLRVSITSVLLYHIMGNIAVQPTTVSWKPLECLTWFYKRLEQIGMCLSGLRCLFLTNKLPQFFSMDALYGHYPTPKILFIWWINPSAWIWETLYVKLFLTIFVGYILCLCSPYGQKDAKYKQTHSYSTNDSKVHGANMGPIWGRKDPGGPHVGPMNLAIWVMATK